jgi:hypothetical protein
MRKGILVRAAKGEVGRRMKKLLRSPVGRLAEGATIGDTTFAEIVGGKGNGDNVTRENTNKVLADLAGDMSDNFHPIIEFDSKLGIGQGSNDLALDLDRFFFRHKASSKHNAGKKGQSDNDPAVSLPKGKTRKG